jgi:hypothetical protein
MFESAMLSSGVRTVWQPQSQRAQMLALRTNIERIALSGFIPLSFLVAFEPA